MVVGRLVNEEHDLTWPISLLCAGLVVSTEHFRKDYSSNVIAELPGFGDASKVVIIGAHYDSRPTSLTVGLPPPPFAFPTGLKEPSAEHEHARPRRGRQCLGYLGRARAGPRVRPERRQVRTRSSPSRATAS